MEKISFLSAVVVLFLLANLSYAKEGNKRRTINFSQQESKLQNFEIKKIAPSYKIEDGLYKIKDKENGTILYLYKERGKVTLSEIDRRCSK